MNNQPVEPQTEIETLTSFIQGSDFSDDVKQQSIKILSLDDMILEQKMYEINELINAHLSDVLDHMGVPPADPNDPEIKKLFEDHEQQLVKISSDLEKDTRLLFDAADAFATDKQQTVTS